MDAGLKHHQKCANDCETTAEIRQKLAHAQASARMQGASFIWLKQTLHAGKDAMQQWQFYEKKSAPPKIKDEYRGFWQKVVNIYAAKLQNFGKSISETSGSLESLQGIPTTPATLSCRSLSNQGQPARLTPMPSVIAIPGTPYLFKACRGEFYLKHPKSGKRYKVRDGVVSESDS